MVGCLQILPQTQLQLLHGGPILTITDVCLQGLQEGTAKYDFIEVMACPGGCIGGGGQPRSADKQILAVSQQPFSRGY
jgi:hypothetical protein